MTCEYCHTLPHRSGCPAEDENIKICSFCGREIYDGDFYIEADGEYYHSGCGYFGDETDRYQI